MIKPLRIRLEEARKNFGIPWEVIERDYILSWILAGVSLSPLKNFIVFKGGTALKKCYFGDYRFSEDLDFSALPGTPIGDDLKGMVEEVCKISEALLNEYAPVSIFCERYVEKEPHPGGQEAFSIRAQFPWQRTPQTRAIIEISMDEKIIKKTPERFIIHTYGELLQSSIKVYTLEEIILEKLRAILQHIAKLEQRGWSRSRARDYYDLWRIFNSYEIDLDLSDFRKCLKEKCDYKQVIFQNTDDFFEKNMMEYVEKTWDQWLGQLVPNLPSFELIIKELKPKINRLLSVVHP